MNQIINSLEEIQCLMNLNDPDITTLQSIFDDRRLLVLLSVRTSKFCCHEMLFFHVPVMRSDELEKGMMLAHEDGRRRRGRPRRKWMDEIHEVTGMKMMK